MTEQIRDCASLERWLSDKPIEWAQLIALRSALRAIPIIERWYAHPRAQLAVFRATAISWAAQRVLANGAILNRHIIAHAPGAAKAAAAAGSAFTVDAADSDTREQTAAAAAAAHASYAVSHAAEAVFRAIDEAREAAVDAVAAHESAAHAVARADGGAEDIRAAAAEAAVNVVWMEVGNDIAVLQRGDGGPDRLLRQPLWKDAPTKITELRDRLFRSMMGWDINSNIWAQWYRHREQGGYYGFLRDPVADDAFTLRLVEQHNVFWDRDPHEVNAEIVSWLSALEQPLEIEPQNPRAPVFMEDDNGRIDLDAQVGNDAVQRDVEAADRHDEAREVVQQAIIACSSNAAAATRLALERYCDALGETVNNLRPGQLIPRGEALRQELAQRERDTAESRDTSLPPISDQAMLALRNAVTAHNLLVGLDPELARLDEVRFGPDAVEGQMAPARVLEIVEAGTHADVLAPDARDALVTVAANAPAVADPASRQSRQLTETARNFGRKVLEILSAARAAPVSTIAGVFVATSTVSAGVAATGAGGVVAGVVTAGGGAVAAALSCLKLGQLVVKNEDWFRDLFKGNAKMQSVIDRILRDLATWPLK